MKKLIVMTLFGISTLFSSEVFIKDTSDKLKLTIYNDDLMMVSDIRNFELNEFGKNKLIFPNVSSKIINESIFVSFYKNIKVLSQGYSFNVLNFKNLLKNNLGKNVYVKNNFNSLNSNLISVKLLSINPILVKDENNNIFKVRNEDIVFNNRNDLKLYPQLFWNITTQNIGKNTLSLKYLSNGISWKSNYILNIDKEKASLKGWISVKNTSGINYKNAEVIFLSGNVNKVNSRKIPIMYKAMSFSKNNLNIKSESFSNYHIYKIPFKVDLKNDSTKQISFLYKENLRYKKYGKISFRNKNVGFYKRNVEQYIEIINDKKNSFVYPSGIIRVYKTDYSDNTYFIGEDRINNIQKKENPVIKLGEIFDLKIEREVKDYYSKNNKLNINETYIIKNESDQEQVIKFKRNINFNNNINNFIYKDNCKNYFCKNITKNRLIKEYELKINAYSSIKLDINFKIN